MTFTASQMELIATRNGLIIETVTSSESQEVEYLAVRLKFTITAFFTMGETGEYKYSHTYNSETGKTTKRTPYIFS
mgnify:CR=1 FL=1